jgi:hypothetical protein
LQTRFEDKLSFQLDVEAEEDEMLVPMTLQLLIENCVKHNEISASKPLQIRIVRKDDSLKVENNLQPRPLGTESRKTGLSNISQQYKYFTDKGIVITETDRSYAVAVPSDQKGPKMKAIILEDENRAVNHLKRLIHLVAPEMELLAVFDTVRDAVAYLEKNPDLDLVFSDVQLADGVSFEIFLQGARGLPHHIYHGLRHLRHRGLQCQRH